MSLPRRRFIVAVGFVAAAYASAWAERQDTASILEIRPEGRFLTYGVGVPLMRMRDPAASRARVPVA